MKFVRDMMLVFGWIFLLFSGGCAITALVTLGPGWVAGSSDKMLIGFTKLSLFAVIVSALLGWWLVKAGEKK